MVNRIIAVQRFEKKVEKIKDRETKRRLNKRIGEIVKNPEIGKPLRFSMKGSRAVRIKPFRIIYALKEEVLYLLDFEHRETVYK